MNSRGGNPTLNAKGISLWTIISSFNTQNFMYSKYDIVKFIYNRYKLVIEAVLQLSIIVEHKFGKKNFFFLVSVLTLNFYSQVNFNFTYNFIQMNFNKFYIKFYSTEF